MSQTRLNIIQLRESWTGMGISETIQYTDACHAILFQQFICAAAFGNQAVVRTISNPHHDVVQISTSYNVLLHQCEIFLAAPVNYHLVPNQIKSEVAPAWVETALTLQRMLTSGLHKSLNPTIRDASTSSKFGALGEHGAPVCSGSQRTVLWFSEHCALCLGIPVRKPEFMTIFGT